MMPTTLTEPTAQWKLRVLANLPQFRTGERVAAGFFLYLAALAWIWPLDPARRTILLAIPAAMALLVSWEQAHSRPFTRVMRDWLSQGLILAGYWSVGWFLTARVHSLEGRWVSWDRALLDGIGLRAAIESLGVVIPSLLEVSYLLLYALPPVCLCVIYAYAGRREVHRFLFTLFLGTFAAYALLPYLPVESPRVVFQGLDLPNVTGFARPLNTWLLDHLDISTSVFPSGHVAVAFASAFGLLRALPHRRRVAIPAFGMAALVYLATVYGRYHYAVDGLASFAIAGTTWLFTPNGRDDV